MPVEFTSPEEWRPVPTYEDLYLVSSHARVRSLRSGRIMKTCVDAAGYLCLNLHNGGARVHRVHRLMLRAFVGEPVGAAKVACHNNGVRLDNRLDNLRWDTPAGNVRDRLAHGTHNRGERCGTSKLTEAKVKELRDAYRAGAETRDLANEMGMSQGAVCRAVFGETWFIVPNPCVPRRPGGGACGERNNASKITWDIVDQIRSRAAAGEQQASIARSLCLSAGIVNRVVLRRTWKTRPTTPKTYAAQILIEPGEEG